VPHILTSQRVKIPPVLFTRNGAEANSVRVLKNPRTRGSTLRCFNCGREVPKSLATRIHACPFCGVVMHRDYKSTLVHLKDAVGLTGSSRLWRSRLYNHPSETGCKRGRGSRNYMRPSSISRSRWKPTTLAVEVTVLL